jgi:hypothetical protein
LQITELKAQIHNTETQHRQKTKNLIKRHEDEMSELRLVTKDLQMKNASLRKQSKVKGAGNAASSTSNSRNNSPDN